MAPEGLPVRPLWPRPARRTVESTDRRGEKVIEVSEKYVVDAVQSQRRSEAVAEQRTSRLLARCCTGLARILENAADGLRRRAAH